MTGVNESTVLSTRRDEIMEFYTGYAGVRTQASAKQWRWLVDVRGGMT